MLHGETIEVQIKCIAQIAVSVDCVRCLDGDDFFPCNMEIVFYVKKNRAYKKTQRILSRSIVLSAQFYVLVFISKKRNIVYIIVVVGK